MWTNKFLTKSNGSDESEYKNHSYTLIYLNDNFLQDIFMGHFYGIYLWIFFLKDTLGHFCGTLLQDIFVGNSCGIFLQIIFMEYFYRTLLRNTFVKHFYGDVFVGHLYGIFLQENFAGHFFGDIFVTANYRAYQRHAFIRACFVFPEKGEQMKRNGNLTRSTQPRTQMKRIGRQMKGNGG